MYHGVTSVRAVDGYRLIIGFDNGECRVFDAKPLLTFGCFRELASPEEFRKVRVSYDTIEWENGLDLDPEYLHERSEAIPNGQAAAATRADERRG